MAAGVLDKALWAVWQLAAHNPLHGVGVNGHGETTFLEGWAKTCRAIAARGLPIGIYTNLAKVFSADEIDVLGSMDGIVVSIDTADRELLRRVRRHVDLERIMENIRLIRAAAGASGRRAPVFEFSCGLYDKNTLYIERYAELAIELQIRKIHFWTLAPLDYENWGISESEQVQPLSCLSDDELRPRLVAVQRARRMLQNAGIDVMIDANFLTPLEERVGLNA
jgi:MoaA/NifB/PqqE/SkfB family radical SAM enzyme